MNKFIRHASIAAFLMATALSVSAQDKAKDIKKDKETQEIVIRKKGKDVKKMTIVVDGDQVIINGKPVEDFENADVKVFLRDRPSPYARAYGGKGEIAPIPPVPPIAPVPPAASLWMSQRPMLGVVTDKSDSGAVIREVTRESGAEKAGLKKGDVITKVGGEEIENPQDLVEAIGDHEPKDTIDIIYLRDGKQSTTKAILSESKTRSYTFNGNDFNFNMPEDLNLKNFRMDFNGRPKIGLQIQDVEEGKGVTVKDVDDDSPASKAGLKEGDVITSINGEDIADVDAAKALLHDLKAGDAVSLGYKRDGKSQTIQVKIPKRMKMANL